jgi:hypothetical protein
MLWTLWNTRVAKPWLSLKAVRNLALGIRDAVPGTWTTTLANARQRANPDTPPTTPLWPNVAVSTVCPCSITASNEMTAVCGK